MAQLNRISDEELASYLERMLSDGNSARADSVMDIDTFEVLNVSRKAIGEFPSDNVIPLPSWGCVDASSIRPAGHGPFAMAGFLGENSSEETAVEGAEDDE